MQRNLETLKETLWLLFEEAAARHCEYSDSKYDKYTNTQLANRSSMAKLALAITAIEREQREQGEAQNGLRLAGKPKMAANQ